MSDGRKRPLHTLTRQEMFEAIGEDHLSLLRLENELQEARDMLREIRERLNHLGGKIGSARARKKLLTSYVLGKAA